MLKIATIFNDQYDNGDYGPVYDRWDTRSQAVTARAQYIEHHKHWRFDLVLSNPDSVKLYRDDPAAVRSGDRLLLLTPPGERESHS